MHKSLNIITALLFCANIAVGAQDSVNDTIARSRVKSVGPSGTILSSNIGDIYKDTNGVYQKIKTVNDVEDASFSITEVAIDPLAIALPVISVIELIAGIKWAHSDKSGHAIAKAIATAAGFIVLACETGARLRHNDKLTNGKHWIKSKVDGDFIMLGKKNEAWKVYYRSWESRNLPKLSDQEAQQLAEAIIAQHGPEVNEQDLFTSEIFQTLISDFKSRC